MLLILLRNINKFRLRQAILYIACFCSGINLAPAQGNASARYEINAKRVGVLPGDKDALPRSREFLRLDSTYYVGWLYEGLYKFSRSADYLGYKYSIVPLEKALSLLEKDFGNNLRNVYSSIAYYQQNLQLFDDFHQLCFALERCYNNLEMPDQTMTLLNRIESFHLQEDYISIYSDKAWTYHRNRFFTSQKFPFLKNSIPENEEMAFKCCYLQIERIKKNASLNTYWYGTGQVQQDLLTVYHYLALLHNYNQNYDSSEYYYRRLIEGGRVLWGNYANMKHETANFDESIFYYKKRDYLADYALSEPDYYLPTLSIYGGRTKEAIGISRQKIMQSGSTPGFGWYNIALARGYLYDGQLDSCDFFLTKASHFKELHINTTLTQSQYEFTINLLRIQLLDKKAERIKFFNPGWWYSFSDLYAMLSLKTEKLLLEYALAHALAYNPERKRVMYDLFCAESTFSFDETLYLLKNFSLPYFINKYNLYHAMDKRERVYRYFDLFVAKFKYENGDKEEAVTLCRKLLSETIYNSDNGRNPQNVFEYEHEKLFLARLYEILSDHYEGDKNELKYQNGFYEEFPQLVPFSGVRLQMNLKFEGEEDEVTKEVMKDIKNCNIDFEEKANTNIPQAIIFFTKKGKSYQAVVNVISASGKQIVNNEQMIFKNGKGVGRELALRLFAKGGAVSFEEEEIVASAGK
jgi:hypothetical protein